MQDVNFATVNSPSATDIKDGSSCEFLQSFEIRITALDWTVFLHFVVEERNLTKCECSCLEYCDAVQLGIHV